MYTDTRGVYIYLMCIFGWEVVRGGATATPVSTLFATVYELVRAVYGYVIFSVRIFVRDVCGIHVYLPRVCDVAARPAQD